MMFSFKQCECCQLHLPQTTNISLLISCQSCNANFALSSPSLRIFIQLIACWKWKYHLSFLHRFFVRYRDSFIATELDQKEFFRALRRDTVEVAPRLQNFGFWLAAWPSGVDLPNKHLLFSVRVNPQSVSLWLPRIETIAVDSWFCRWWNRKPDKKASSFWKL